MTHILNEETGPPVFIMQTLGVSAWCGRRDSNPHNFRHWNLNPARLPVPPRPREKHPVRPRCRERRAYNMSPPVRSKKMAALQPSEARRRIWTDTPENGPHRSDGKPRIPAGPTRADGRIGGCRSHPAMARRRHRPGRVRSLALQATAGSLALRPGAPATPIWALTGPELRFRRGETAEIAFANELHVPTAARHRGESMALRQPNR